MLAYMLCLLDYLCLFPTCSMPLCAYACSSMPYPKPLCMPRDASSNHFDMPMYAVCPTRYFVCLLVPLPSTLQTHAQMLMWQTDQTAIIETIMCLSLVVWQKKANGFSAKAYITDYLLIVHDCNIPGKIYLITISKTKYGSIINNLTISSFTCLYFVTLLGWSAKQVVFVRTSL